MSFTLLYKRSPLFRSFHQYTIKRTLRASSPYRIHIPRQTQACHSTSSGLIPLRNQYFLRSFVTTRSLKMASDEDYMAFLDKANKDPSEGYAKPQSSGNKEFKATDAGAQIPAAIQEATKDSFYVSDADEPFVPVYLAWDESGKGLPDEEEFASLIQHPDPSSAQIEIQDPADWDSQGQYSSIVDAVRKAGKGNDVRVYRVAKGGVKVEYWVVTTEGKGANAKLVGAKALAVES
ncbi:hypothetical protein F5Y04DRAFT_245703 [Hypomontagnella monticulosa]|nr:hypothetical protein F5Y04DRAFT_245703 [Hypomontagnella monticulosa]